MKRDDALRAVAAGWRKDTLLAIKHWMAACDNEDIAGHFLTDFIFVIVGDRTCAGMNLHLYRSYSPKDVEHAFAGSVLTYDQEVEVFADGSGTTFDKPAGIGVLVRRPWANPELIAENIGCGTNNRAELCAVWRGLRAIPHTAQSVVIKTDSEYTIGALTKDWARNANAQLIGNIRADLACRPNVRFEHVDGHSGHEGNEIADKLAGIGRKLVTQVSQYED